MTPTTSSTVAPLLREAFARGFTWVWSGWLAATILLAGTRFHPTLAGRLALTLIVLGFAVFTIGRRGRLDGADDAPPGRATFALAYYGGYAMMLSAALLTTALAVGEWVA